MGMMGRSMKGNAENVLLRSAPLASLAASFVIGVALSAV